MIALLALRGLRRHAGSVVMMVMAMDQSIHDAFECTNPAPALSTQKIFCFRAPSFIHIEYTGNRAQKLFSPLWLNR